MSFHFLKNFNRHYLLTALSILYKNILFEEKKTKTEIKKTIKIKFSFRHVHHNLKLTVLPIIWIFDDAQPHAELFNFGKHFLLHQIYTHREQGYAHENIKGHNGQHVFI